jgi:hypothetical protein
MRCGEWWHNLNSQIGSHTTGRAFQIDSKSKTFELTFSSFGESRMAMNVELYPQKPARYTVVLMKSLRLRRAEGRAKWSVNNHRQEEFWPIRVQLKFTSRGVTDSYKVNKRPKRIAPGFDSRRIMWDISDLLSLTIIQQQRPRITHHFSPSSMQSSLWSPYAESTFHAYYS